MSRWRQKGFVLDSDEEEEEGRIESQTQGKDATDRRADRNGVDGRKVVETSENSETEDAFTPRHHVIPRRPTPSPLTPFAALASGRDRTESPDPLQSSPTPNIRRSRLFDHLSPSESRNFQPNSPQQNTWSNNEPAIFSQISNHIRPSSHPFTANSATQTTDGSRILNKFGIAPLSDDSGDDSLSDPPSDLESPSPRSALPHRRTAVRIVIPSSTILQNQIIETRTSRDFRQRKPIQLHPYALEGEIYRREVQSRGLKPVPRERSPQRQPQDDTETQENEFDPNEIPSSSPPECEIPVSTLAIQRSRKDTLKGVSIHASNANPSARHPSTQLRLPNKTKRRKPNTPVTQTTTLQRNIFDDDIAQHNMWSVPPNSPPFSSSPPLKMAGPIRSLEKPNLVGINRNLPTPSTSSVAHDGPPHSASDSEPVPRSARRSGAERRRLTRTVLVESQSATSELSSDPDHSDNELRKVGKRIKGVLPASWLRFDRHTQERRKALEQEKVRARLDSINSLARTEPQPGVAKKVTKRAGRPSGPRPSVTPSRDVVTISDDSDDSLTGFPTNRDEFVQQSIEDASALAAIFDSRYADDDLSDMENDRLHLPTLGGAGSKRKRQTKVTNTFGRAKRLKSAHGETRGAKGEHRLHGRTAGNPKYARSERRRSPLPAMSVIDVDISPNRSSDVPQFLKIARRQALRRPDLARQSLSNKQVRLHSARDTEDANVTLRQWRQGTLKPKYIAESLPPNLRLALADKVDNQQQSQSTQNADRNSTKDPDKSPAAETRAPWPRQQNNLPQGLRIFQRCSPRNSKNPLRSQNIPKSTSNPRKVFGKTLPVFRTAQLEDDEKDFGQGHRKTTFQKGLHRFEQQFATPKSLGQPLENPILARFLSEENAVLTPSASADDAQKLPEISSRKGMRPARRRLIHKPKSRRIDVESREYRQPSEPAIEEILKTSASIQKDTELEQDQNSLLGLAPYGTRYPITFDVYSLASETYFHSSTFIGSDDFRCALLLGKPGGRDLSASAGYHCIAFGSTSIRCGPWNDQTFAGIRELAKAIWAPLENQPYDGDKTSTLRAEILEYSARFLRSMITYVTTHLSFLDPVDRADFVAKMNVFIKSLFDQLLAAYAVASEESFISNGTRQSIHAMSYLLVLGLQVHQIAQDENISRSHQFDTASVVQPLSQIIITHLVRHGVSELSTFLETNKRHTARINGVQETEILVESTLICMHGLEAITLPSHGFWSVASQELKLAITKATRLEVFESTWATIFSFLPFVEVDRSGIPARDRRLSFRGDDWIYIRDLLKQLFELYPNSAKKQSSSLNDYVRASLSRCHRLIYYWHWRQPEQMLNAVLDFFGKNGLKQLRRENGLASVSYLEYLPTEQSLALQPNETAFHIALKCLALGLNGMQKTHSEKKIRSFVFRTIPNHGRTYPKDQPLDEESLAALRNHHDLLATLYWAAPPPCRPKLDHIRHLVNHESSHREACRLNVRAWANLTKFQLSTEEPSSSATPFALWHKEIMHQTLRQYLVAKTEADDYLKLGSADGSTVVSTVMVRQTMEKNQEQVIATLRDCITGMRKAIQHAKDKTSLKGFLVDSDIIHLLELPHLEDRRLVSLIRDSILLLREYAASQDVLPTKPVDQLSNEESQDYGEFPDLDDLDSSSAEPLEIVAGQSILDFVQLPLWRLLSNAFGAEILPDENLLMDCVDAWVFFAKITIQSGDRSWSYYIDSFSQVSWQQLRHTEQTRKFGPYFMAALIDCDSSAYREHQHEFVKALMLSLLDRESMLRFQHLLLLSIARTDHDHPLMRNLPFFRGQQHDSWDITPETLEMRRLSLISSILSNMRDDVNRASFAEQGYAAESRRRYAILLKDFMATMKNNYQQLRQGTKVTGAYVEFLQKIVQFLKQYTSEICPVLPFFTDSVAFPLPATDPTYVVGHLCGYATKTTDLGASKQLSVFVQTIAQQAAADNQQPYLVDQLTTALCTNEALTSDAAALRAILLQSIFPVYLELAFSSIAAFLVAQPVLQSLPSVLNQMIFDLRITQPSTVSSIARSVMSVLQALVRGSEHLKNNRMLFHQRHILSSLTYMLETATSSISLLEYISNRISGSISAHKLPIVAYMSSFSLYVAEVIEERIPQDIPVFEGDSGVSFGNEEFETLYHFSKRGLENDLKANWKEKDGAVWFGHGHTSREVVIDTGSMKEERANVSAAIDEFHCVLHKIFGNEKHIGNEERDFGNELVI